MILWLVYATKLRGEGKALPLRPRYWPVWEMVAATFAYFAWAFALPQTPFANFSWYSPSLSSLAVLVVSTILGLLAPLFQRPLDSA